MLATLRRLHCWLSLGAGVACWLVALAAGPLVGFALFVIGLGLVFDGATIVWAGAARTGGLPDHRQ